MRNVAILGVPMDLGAGRRGVDMGPSAIRLAGLDDALAGLGHAVRDLGNIEVPIAETLSSGSGPRFVKAISDACRMTYRQLQVLDPGTLPICLGGDHSISMGTVAGLTTPGSRTGLLWIDAHADINTPQTSPSQNVHGMPLAHLLGMGDPELLRIWGGGSVIHAQDVVYIGLRSVDDEERALIHDLNIRAYTMMEVDRMGVAAIASEALDYLSGTDRIHLSFDADVLDPDLAPGVGTPVPGGLSYREAHLLMELFAAANVVTSVDLVEVNPFLDVRNRTAAILVEMATSLMGKRIL